MARVYRVGGSTLAATLAAGSGRLTLLEIRTFAEFAIAEHMRAGDLRFDARLLGDDGHRLWFFVGSIGAWDYRQDRLVDAGDLRRANPALGKFASKDNRGDPLISPSVAQVVQPARDLWSGESRLYGFDGRLKVTTPDFRGVYEMDPETLRARVN